VREFTIPVPMTKEKLRMWLLGDRKFAGLGGAVHPGVCGSRIDFPGASTPTRRKHNGDSNGTNYRQERASEIRIQVVTLGQELAKLREKLDIAQRSLAPLKSKRDALAEELADGKPHKSTVGAEIHAAIATANIPVEVLQKRVSEKEVALDSARDSLASLEREISIEANLAARIGEVKALAGKGAGIAARINEMLAQLEQELAALGEVRKGLAPFTFAGAESLELAGLARAAIHATGQEAFMDGSFLASERRLLREGWTVRGDISLTVQ
jgi:chorismate mutase